MKFYPSAANVVTTDRTGTENSMLPRHNAVSLSVSIVYYDTDYDIFNETLKSIRSAMDVVVDRALVDDAVLIVIDNGGSTSVLVQMIEDLFEGGKHLRDVIETGGNIGYGAGHNLAIFNYVSDYHLIINPDVLLDRKALDHAIRYMIDHPKIGMLTPYSEGPDGKKQNLCKYYPSIFRLFLRGFVPKSISRLFEKSLGSYEVELKDEETILSRRMMASGCFMFTRYSVLDSIRGFSPDFFVYFEDFDLSIRINRVSRIAYAPDVRIIHKGGFASKKGPDHVLMFVKSASIFFRKYGWRWL